MELQDRGGTQASETDLPSNNLCGVGCLKKKKVLILGDSGCGKASLVDALTDQVFESGYRQSLGIGVYVKEMLDPDGNERHCLDLWLCSGAVRYLPLVQQNYEETDVAILVYDITKQDSMQKCVFWRNELLRACPSCKMFLVGCKTDLDDQIRISEENGSKQADSWGIAHFRVSSKLRTGVDELLQALIKQN